MKCKIVKFIVITLQALMIGPWEECKIHHGNMTGEIINFKVEYLFEKLPQVSNVAY